MTMSALDDLDRRRCTAVIDVTATGAGHVRGSRLRHSAHRHELRNRRRRWGRHSATMNIDANTDGDFVDAGDTLAWGERP